MSIHTPKIAIKAYKDSLNGEIEKMLGLKPGNLDYRSNSYQNLYREKAENAGIKFNLQNKASQGSASTDSIKAFKDFFRIQEGKKKMVAIETAKKDNVTPKAPKAKEVKEHSKEFYNIDAQMGIDPYDNKEKLLARTTWKNVLSLHDAFIDMDNLVMRPIDEQHVDSMVASLKEGKKLPAIQVCGYILDGQKYALLLGGYHRIKAYYKYFASQSLDENGEIKEEALKLKLENNLLLIEVFHDMNESKALMQVWKSNEFNAKNVDSKSRGRIAVFLMIQQATPDGKSTLGQREVARQLGISHTGVAHAIKFEYNRRVKAGLPFPLWGLVKDESEEVAQTIKEIEANTSARSDTDYAVVFPKQLFKAVQAITNGLKPEEYNSVITPMIQKLYDENPESYESIKLFLTACNKAVKPKAAKVSKTAKKTEDSEDKAE